MYELPTSVDINGESYKIRENGDFRVILHCFEVLSAEDLTKKERIIACLMTFYEGLDEVEDVLRLPDMEEAVKQMFNFMNAGQEEQSRASVKLIDWEKDSLLVSSAINNVAGKEIRAEKFLHWWTFIGYYMAIGECALSQIVAIRYKIAHNEKLEKHEKKFRAENPQYFNIDYRTAEQKEAEEYIQNLWNGGA